VQQHQQALVEITNQIANLAARKCEPEWVTRALANFGTVRGLMMPINQRRLLRALLETVIVNEAGGKVDIHFAELQASLPELRRPEAV
jgi:hypothetical protein